MYASPWRGRATRTGEGARICTPRPGPSLYVSITPPGCRVCPFRCTYCAVPKGSRRGPGGRWPAPGELLSSLAQELSEAKGVSSVTVAGAGEPALHPDFCTAVLGVLGVVARDRPELPVRVRTNGAGLQRPEVCRALDLADERIVKLDPAPERTARPGPGAPLGALLARLTTLRDLSVQAVLVDGPAGNADPTALEEWLALLAELRPQRVYLTTPAAPSPDGAALPLDAERLAAAAAWTAGALGVPVQTGDG